jgi:trigger factor
MVEAEFQSILQQLRHEASHEQDPQAALAEVEKEAEEYRHIAERRVRLGLLLSEIGANYGVVVTDDEMNRLIAQAASQYQGKDRDRFIQYVQQEPAAAAQLRAPLYEDKVVDFLFSKAKITDRKATREQLEADLESEEGHVHGPGCGHDVPEAKAKPAKGKAKAAKPPAAEKPAEAKQPVKTKAEPAPKKAKLAAEKTEKAKPEQPLKSEPANKAAAEKVDKAPAKKPAEKAAAAPKAEKPAPAKAEKKPAAKKAAKAK